MKRVCSCTDDVCRYFGQAGPANTGETPEIDCPGAGRPELSNPNVKIREMICKPANF